MCKGTWVCFACRTSVRRLTWRHVTYARPWLIGQASERLRCPRCRKPCQFLGPTIEIPAKSDAKAWRKLRDEVWQVHAEIQEIPFKHSVRRRHNLEKRIRDLKAKPKSKGRDELIKQLREELVREWSPTAQHELWYFIQAARR
jgi:hypothetical protein